MRLLFTTLFGLVILSLTSCKKIEDALDLSADITLTPKSMEFTVPTNSTVNAATTFREIEVTVNLDSLIKAGNPDYGQKNIKGVKVKGFKIEFVDANSSNNFANFSSIYSELSASGKSPIVIVSKDNNPDEEKSSISVPANESLELKDYISSGTFKYILKGKLRRALTKELKTRVIVDYVFSVSLKK